LLGLHWIAKDQFYSRLEKSNLGRFIRAPPWLLVEELPSVPFLFHAAPEQCPILCCGEASWTSSYLPKII